MPGVPPRGPRTGRAAAPLLTATAIVAVLGGFEPLGLARGPARLRNFEVATSALSGERSEKVRVQAALVLGRAGDARATPFLIRALGVDPSATVRAMAAQALGKVGDERARAALEEASNDREVLVQRHAAAALAALTTRLSSDAIAVNPMGDKTHRASAELRERMRAFVLAELRSVKNRRAGGYRVDGAIKVLAVSGRADLVEVKCAVELVLSTWTNSIIMMSSGEAIVQRQRRQVRGAAVQAEMEVEALEHAVRGASEELRTHFAANGPR